MIQPEEGNTPQHRRGAQAFQSWVEKIWFPTLHYVQQHA